MTFSQELLTLSTPPLLEVIRKGQALMIPLIILFCLSLTIILDRTFFWLEWMVRMRRERRLLNAYQKQGHPSGLRGFLGDRMKGNRLLMAVRRSIFLRVLLTVEDSPGRNALWEDEMDGIVSRSERFLSFLALVATLGTSFGLLGTVIGVSKSLEFIQTDFSQTVSGLSVALYTTIGGLIISILSLSAHAIFSGLSDFLARNIVEKANAWKRSESLPAPSPAQAPSPTHAARPAQAASRGDATPPPLGRIFETKEDTLAISPARTDLSSGDMIIEEL